MKLTNNEQWILDYLKVDILPRLKRVGFLCASAGCRIRYGLTPAPQFGDAPPKYILSRIEVAVVYLTAFGTYPFAVAKFQFSGKSQLI